VIKKPQRRRTRPDLGCRAIGWMDGWMDFIKMGEDRTYRRDLVNTVMNEHSGSVKDGQFTEKLSCYY
jgi:hypothetical protein